MEAIRLTGTDESPEVVLDKEANEFKFEGKSLPEDVREFYNPIHQWIDDYAKDPNDNTVVEFNLEYFNSASSKQILDVLERFAVLAENNKSISIKWYFAEDDEDMEDAGDSYADIVNVPFELIGY